MSYKSLYEVKVNVQPGEQKVEIMAAAMGYSYIRLEVKVEDTQKVMMEVLASILTTVGKYSVKEGEEVKK